MTITWNFQKFNTMIQLSHAKIFGAIIFYSRTNLTASPRKFLKIFFKIGKKEDCTIFWNTMFTTTYYNLILVLPFFT